MSKILIIGVGGGGRNTVLEMKETGIEGASYITIGGYRDDYENGEFKSALPDSDIPHYNLVRMNGYENMSYTNNPKDWSELAENVRDQIKEIIESHLKDDTEQEPIEK